METSFSNLLLELSELLETPLKPDALNVCKIKYPDDVLGEVNVQLETDRDQKRLLVGSMIGPLAPGRFREDVLEQALKTNGLRSPRFGDFCFTKNGDLYLYGYLRMEGIKGTHVANYLNAFLDKVRLWKTALKENRVPTVEGLGGPGSTKGTKGMFGLVS